MHARLLELLLFTPRGCIRDVPHLKHTRHAGSDADAARGSLWRRESSPAFHRQSLRSGRYLCLYRVGVRYLIPASLGSAPDVEQSGAFHSDSVDFASNHLMICVLQPTSSRPRSLGVKVFPPHAAAPSQAIHRVSRRSRVSRKHITSHLMGNPTETRDAIHYIQ